eukprot:scaffold4510_cov183-Amphora_coffeaeformis.AAC.86
MRDAELLLNKKLYNARRYGPFHHCWNDVGRKKSDRRLRCETRRPLFGIIVTNKYMSESVLSNTAKVVWHLAIIEAINAWTESPTSLCGWNYNSSREVNLPALYRRSSIQSKSTPDAIDRHQWAYTNTPATSCWEWMMTSNRTYNSFADADTDVCTLEDPFLGIASSCVVVDAKAFHILLAVMTTIILLPYGHAMPLCRHDHCCWVGLVNENDSMAVVLFKMVSDYFVCEGEIE